MSYNFQNYCFSEPDKSNFEDSKRTRQIENIVETEDNEVKVNEDDIDDETFFQTKTEAGVLFGAAYENKYIDILENEDVNDYMEINEKMLEISLGMTKEEIIQLTKIEIKVDTTNTHMQYVGEVLQSLTLLKLDDRPR